MNFASTRYARELFEYSIPKAVKTLERIADALEEANELKKQSMGESSNEQKQSEIMIQVYETYEFDGYYVDCLTDGTFQFFLNDDYYLGDVTPDDVNDYELQLSKGYDMIREQTEDSSGNTLSFEGW